MTSPLVGAWERIDGEVEGYLVLTETHFCELRVRKDRSPWPKALFTGPRDPSQVSEGWRLEMHDVIVVGARCASH